MLIKEIEDNNNESQYFLVDKEKEYGPYDKVNRLHHGYKTEVQTDKGYLYGYVDDEKGEVVLPIYESLKPDYDYYKHKVVGFIFANGTNLGYLDENGKQVVPAKYYAIGRVKNGFSVGHLDEERQRQQDEKPLYDWEKKIYLNMGFCDENGNEVIPCKYYAVRKVLGIYVFQMEKKGRYGVLNEKGEEIMPCNYDSISISKNLIIAEQNGKFGLFDRTGKTVAPIVYKKIRTSNNGIDLVSEDGNVQHLDDNSRFFDNIDYELY